MNPALARVPPRAGAARGLPAAGGIGLKPEHFREIPETCPALGFFEIHAENHMVAGGPFHHYPGRIRELYALSIHGVGSRSAAKGRWTSATTTSPPCPCCWPRRTRRSA